MELRQVLDLRRRLVRSVAFGVVGAGLLGALVAPGLVPPRPLVGAAIGTAACLLAAAAAVAADAGDALVRGPRHVRAAGGKVSMVVPTDDRDAAVEAVAAMLHHRSTGERLRVAVTPVSGSIGGWVDALAAAIARLGRRTVIADLTVGGDPQTRGVAEVAAGEARLADSVEFDDSLVLARIGPGSERALALRALPGFVARIPNDVEVLVVALPGIRHPGVGAALGAVPDSVLVVTAGMTSRVDLMAALKTVASGGGRTDVVLRQESGPTSPLRPAGGGLTAEDGTASGSGRRDGAAASMRPARPTDPGADLEDAPDIGVAGPQRAGGHRAGEHRPGVDDTPDQPTGDDAVGGDGERAGAGQAGTRSNRDTEQLLRVEAALQALSEQVWRVEDRGSA